VLRHPIDRAISQYHYGRSTPIEHFPREQQKAVRNIQESDSLLDFIAHAPEDALDQVGNLQVRYLSRKDENWLLPERGDDALEIAKQSLREFEFVGILERLRDFLTLLAFRMHWPPLDAPRVNVTRKRPTPQELDEKTLQHLSKLNELDLELYRFGCDLFEQRWAEMLDEILRSRAKIRRAPVGGLRTRFAGPKDFEDLRNEMTALPPHACRIKVTCDIHEHLPADVLLEAPVTVTNLGPTPLSSAQPNPVRLSYRWISPNSQSELEGGRLELPLPIPPEGSTRIKMRLQTPQTAGTHQLRITLVQEGIRWFDAVRAENSWISDITIS
ncbi:MAG: hypothetical protein ACRDIA_05390, partial [Actinomycetota bacterium]